MTGQDRGIYVTDRCLCMCAGILLILTTLIKDKFENMIQCRYFLRKSAARTVSLWMCMALLAENKIHDLSSLLGTTFFIAQGLTF